MRHILYNYNKDFNDILISAKGKYELRFFLLFFIASLLIMCSLPSDVAFKESEMITKVGGSIIISILGGYLSKEICRKLAKNKLSFISKSLENNDVHILEEDLENALLSSVETIEDKIGSVNEVINYFLVLDRDRQIKVLEAIKTDLYDGAGRFNYNSLYVLESDEVKKLSIPKEEIDKLISSESNRNSRQKRKLR